MIYSKTTEYAIRALAYLAATENPGGIHTISKKIKVPPAYVSKIFQGLVHSRILDSRRGAHGGYTLLKSPGKLRLITIIRAVDDYSYFSLPGCVMGLTECGCGNPCPLHDVWAETKTQMEKILNETTLLDVISTVGLQKLRQPPKAKLSRKMRWIFGRVGK